MKAGLRHAALLAGVLGLASVASAQNPAQPPPSASPSDSARAAPAAKKKTKPKKVWTADDLDSIRKPWDRYADEKQATEQAAPPAKSPPVAGTAAPDPAPDSVESLARELKSDEDALAQTENMVEKTQLEVFEASDHEHQELAESKLEIFNQDEQELKQKMEETRAQLEKALKQKSSAVPD